MAAQKRDRGEVEGVHVWFDDPAKGHVSEETSEEIILIKDKNGKVIAFEVLNYLSSKDLADVTDL